MWNLPGRGVQTGSATPQEPTAKPWWPGSQGPALQGSPWGGPPSQELALWPWLPHSVQDAHCEAAPPPSCSVFRTMETPLEVTTPIPLGGPAPRLARLSQDVGSLWPLGDPGLHQHQSTQGGLGSLHPTPQSPQSGDQGSGMSDVDRGHGMNASRTAFLYIH